MLKIVVILLLLFIYILVPAQDSVISGNWYSKDGTRQYYIRENEQGWEAVLVQSVRKNEVFILKQKRMLLPDVTIKWYRNPI